MRIACFALWAACAAQSATVQGTVTGRGKPVADALVMLEGQQDSYVAQTDSAGRFRMQDVLPGAYVVKSEREGFINAATTPVRCTVENEPLGLEIRLVPLGAVTGRVTDTEGEAISHASVEAMRFAYPHGKRELTMIARGRTDDRGEYRIAGLPPGRYFVRASLLFSGLDAGSSAMRIRGDRPSLTYGYTQTQSELDLAAGGELRDVNVQLQPEKRYAIRASVTGPSNANVMVSSRATAPRASMFGNIGGAMGSGRTMTFPNNVPGLYVVEASDDKRTLHARRTVEVVNADVDIALQLAPSLTLAGAVVVEGSAPLRPAGLRITLEAPEEWNSTGAPVSSAGVFTIQQAQAMQYRVRLATPPGCYLKSIHQGTRLLDSPRIDLSRSIDPLSIAIGTDGAKLDGMAVEGASVVLVPTGSLADWADLVRTATAGPDGAFHLADIAPGTYQLLAWADVEPGAPLDPNFRAPYVAKATAVTVKAGERQTVRVEVIPAQ
jgi:hypothetical protein